MTQLVGHSISYRITVGPRAGRKVFTPQTLPRSDPERKVADGLGKAACFSLHAGVVAKAEDRKRLERLYQYVSRSALSEMREQGADLAITHPRLILLGGSTLKGLAIR